MPDINWYPGHMAKSRRLLLGQLKAVDAVVELCDARAPIATRNPDLNAMLAGKNRVLVLNKADLASDNETQRWLAYFKANGQPALKFNSNGGNTKQVLSAIEQATKQVVDRMKARGVNKTVRLMVVGIPNVGKSSFINRLYGSAIAKASDRPGVTRSNQWVKVSTYLELLDTPGMLWPKLENQRYAQILAYLGSIRDQIMDSETLAAELLELLLELNPEATKARYKLPDDLDEQEPELLLEAACKGRGWLLSGGRYDTDRAAGVILDEFRGGKIGKYTLEPCKK
ncbi:ribosome biogenesis GTPase YlqF [Eubacteriales bacterium OttesenSCG-928-N13]|nr:ribosome biogenesis GTPase YlqF [Eubacteriales bacterium OttesenSCG-928-N13]